MGTPVRVLIVEDSELDAHLLLHELERSGYEPEYEIVDSPETMAAALGKSWDLVIADYVLPHFSGLDALRMVQERGSDTPFIMVSGKIGEDVAIDTMRAGAQDYVLKTSLGRLGPATKREIRDARRRQRTNEARSQAENALQRAYAEQELRVVERTEELSQANWLLSREIEERKRLEEALRESEERFRAIFEQAPLGVALIDAFAGRFIQINQRYCQIAGRNADEMLAMDWMAVTHPDDLQADMDNMKRLIDGETPFYSMEKRYLREDGSVVWVYLTVVPMWTEGQPATYHIAMVDDITERRHLEDALRESEEHYRTLYDAIDEGFCIIEVIFDKDGKPIDYRFLDVNPAFERQTGLIDARGKRMRELRPKHEEHWFEIYGRIALTGEPSRFENRAEQLHRWYDVHAFRFGQPEKRQVAVLFDDITERKQTEEALQESVREFGALAESIPQIVWATRPDGWNTYFNQQWVDYTGVTLEESYGHGWNIPFHPDDRQRAWDAWQNAVQNDKPYSLECRLRRADGVYRWWLIRGAPLRDASGEIVKWFGTCTDIQDIKQAEEALAEARAEAERRAAELQSFITSMADGVAVWDADGHVVFMNEAGRRILGVPPDTPLEAVSGSYELRTLEGELIPKEQWGSRRALRGEAVKDFRARMVTPWKETIVSYSAAPVLDSEGRVIGATSVLRDVSERAELERQREELYGREHRIAQMLQSALVPPTASMDIEGCRASLRYEPALKEAEVGGDFYDVFQLGEGRVGIVIGDIAGKGLAAAVYVAAAKHAIRSYAYLFASPAEVMRRANDVLCATTLEDQMETSMLTAFFAVVDARAGSMVYANAGHETPVIRHADSSTEELGGSSIALGVACGREYNEFRHDLCGGDTVVMVTDGITEARLSGTLLFGKDGVMRFLSEHPTTPLRDIPSGLLEAARQFGGGRLQDDAAIVAFQCDVESTAGE